MPGVVTALYRHPIKGFTPQPLDRVRLSEGVAFPGDRLFAVEEGPSGFDPADPKWIPKRKFAVLAHCAEVAGVRTLVADDGVLTARGRGGVAFDGDLATEEGKTAFAAWLTAALGDAAGGPLKVVEAPGHQFLDHPLGHVSVLNLASLRDMESRTGRRLDPARLRANVHVEGWPAWVENGWTGAAIRLGAVQATVFATITRCAAPGVDPITAERDIDFTAELHRLYGHMLMGVYLHLEAGGEVALGDPAIGPEGA